MKKYLVAALLIVILIVGCTPKQKVPETTAPTAPTVDVDASNSAPAEKLDNELDTKNLDTIDSELDDMTW